MILQKFVNFIFSKIRKAKWRRKYPNLNCEFVNVTFIRRILLTLFVRMITKKPQILYIWIDM